MKITKTNKNIFTLMNSDLNHDYYFINPVNIQGIMGKGLAKDFKRHFPTHFLQYKNKCISKDIKIGKLFFDNENKIIAFPTKRHWKEKSKIEYLEKGLENLVFETKKRGIKNIVLPKIGCGLGGLNFEEEVLPLINNKLRNSHLRKVVILEWNTKK